MRYYHKIIVACLVMLVFSSGVMAGAGDGVFFRNIRNNAMGGVGILGARGANAFVYNPALLNRGNISIRPLNYPRLK